MSERDCLHAFSYGNAQVEVYESADAAGKAAAEMAAEVITRAIQQNGIARVIAATGNSQVALIESLVKRPVDWSAVELFHMDEYVGMRADHPSSFRNWIKNRLENQVRPRKVHYLEGDSPDLDGEIRRYAQLLMEAPIDVAFVGFGENGHIAFNDPYVADFNDTAVVKRISLDEASRRQQAGEGHFRDIASVPQEAITITCPGLFRAKTWVCSVPDARKAEAVRNALEGPISEACPASLVRKHPDAHVYLDTPSASLLSKVSSGVGATR